MKKIITLLTSAILLCTYLQLPSQAQDDLDVEINSEEETKPTSSYLGLGGTIGISGDATPLSEGGFSLIGRTAFTDNFSLHTSSVFQDDGLSLFAITFGVPIHNNSSERELFFPFLGAGVGIEDLFGDFEADALITAGVDIPIGRRFVGTVRVNTTFPEDDTDVGLLLGVGYNFSIFDLLF